MDNIKRFKTIVNTNIPYIEPSKLKELAKGFKESDKFPDITSSFEFPPKSIDLVIEILFEKKYDKLNFFDIARLVSQFEQDKISDKVMNKNLFTISLQELFNFSQKYIQNLIIKITARILLNNKEHSFYKDLFNNMNSKEFVLIKFCINKDFLNIEKLIKNQSIKKVLKYFGIYRIFNNIQNEYSNYILKTISNREIKKDNFDCYDNNLLYDDDLDNLYLQLNKIITIIENKSKNSDLLDVLIKNKLGNIEDATSNWDQLVIPPDLKERYRRLKGLFEFQRFVNIAKYLTSNPNIHFSSDENSSDEKRLNNRSAFWSNYDEKFSSVKMWVNEEDYKLMEIDKPVDLRDIKQLDNINNEACMLEFKDAKLLIIEFFRLKDGYNNYNSLVFEDYKILKVKEMLDADNFNNELYKKLEKLSDYSIKHIFLWQGWVDEFLRRRNIYPNSSILNGTTKFISAKEPLIQDRYDKNSGLEKARQRALEASNSSKYDDVIILNNKNRF